MMRFVIVAKPANEGGVLLYFAGDGFRPNLLQAARFRTEKDAQRRVRFSVICRRMDRERRTHRVSSIVFGSVRRIRTNDV